MLRQFDSKALQEQFRSAQPFPSICIDDFLEPEFARKMARSYPDYQASAVLGREFDAVNERRKIQITDPEKFPEPVKQAAAFFASEGFRRTLSEITGIPDLLWDPTYSGGGMHQSATSGRLDVHVDFNRLSSSGLYRRVNLLLYLNEHWEAEWGGKLELWDREVKRCFHSFDPIFNRCILFETSDISYHGVTKLRCPDGVTRRSFALYYYSKEAPSHALHGDHSTIFKARPNEPIRRYLLMPGETLHRRALQEARRMKRRVTDLLKVAKGSAERPE